jgi:hypothetical protein
MVVRPFCGSAIITSPNEPSGAEQLTTAEGYDRRTTICASNECVSVRVAIFACGGHGDTTSQNDVHANRTILTQDLYRTMTAFDQQPTTAAVPNEEGLVRIDWWIKGSKGWIAPLETSRAGSFIGLTYT